MILKHDSCKQYIVIVRLFLNNQIIMYNRSNKDIRHMVVKNNNQNQDATIMARLQSERSIKTQNEKHSRMEQFMNNTKLNASKIYKQQMQKKIQSSNVKKSMNDKQKQVRAKYTLLDKKKDMPRDIDVEPTKVDWNRLDPAAKGVNVPIERMPINSDSEDGQSGVDSEYENSNIRSPMELIKAREDIRNKMLNKYREGKR